MDTDKSIRAALDAEIDRLEHARALLGCHTSTARRAAGVSSKPAVRFKPAQEDEREGQSDARCTKGYLVQSEAKIVGSAFTSKVHDGAEMISQPEAAENEVIDRPQLHESEPFDVRR